MRLVVDANILYSVVLSTNGVVADVFFNTRPPLELFAPQLLRKELDRHRPRMAKYTGTSVARVTEVIELLSRRINFIDPALIADNAWVKAKELTGPVDPDDEDYVALALHLGCPLWTGDLKLTRALKGSNVTPWAVLKFASMINVHDRLWLYHSGSCSMRTPNGPTHASR